MSRVKLVVLAVVALLMAGVLGLLLLPRVVMALPGSYVARLQNHELTGPVMELLAPMPSALPAVSDGGQMVAPSAAPQIPGLEGGAELIATPTLAASATPGATATAAPPTPEITPSPTITPTLTPTPTPTHTPSPSPTPLPSRVVLEGLRWVTQGFNNCGPANLSISLNYWGDGTTQEMAAAYLKPNREDRNVSPWQISDYVNEFTNLRATAHARGNLEMLKQLIAAGFPVVIEKGYIPGRGTEGWYGHYLTVYGFNDERQEMYSRDTFLGPFDGNPRADSYEQFMEWWRHFYYTFYVIFPAEREGEVMAIIPPQLQDDWTMWEYAAEEARLELEQRPDDVFSLFNLGVALTRLGEYASEETVEDYSPAVNAAYYEEAAALFDRARNTNQLPPRTLWYEHRPLMAYYKTGRHNDVLELTAALLDTIGGRWVEEIHWYRGHALAATGDLLGAQEAYQQALVVNPNFYYAQWSLDDVNNRLGG